MKERKRTSLMTLILVNLIPIAGVLFWDWSIANIMILYWTENLVIVLINILRMKAAQGELPEDFDNPYGKNATHIDLKNKNLMILLFIFNVGTFVVVHGFFIFSLFNPQENIFIQPTYLLAVVGLVISHYVSYRVNFIKSGEYKIVAPAVLIMQPYRRIAVMHMTIFVSAYTVQLLGAPIIALVSLVILKIVFDAGFHIREHKKFEQFGKYI